MWPGSETEVLLNVSLALQGGVRADVCHLSLIGLELKVFPRFDAMDIKVMVRLPFPQFLLPLQDT